jgi:hypothetical protein
MILITGSTEGGGLIWTEFRDHERNWYQVIAYFMGFHIRPKWKQFMAPF